MSLLVMFCTSAHTRNRAAVPVGQVREMGAEKGSKMVLHVPKICPQLHTATSFYPPTNRSGKCKLQGCQMQALIFSFESKIHCLKHLCFNHKQKRFQASSQLNSICIGNKTLCLVENHLCASSCTCPEQRESTTGTPSFMLSPSNFPNLFLADSLLHPANRHHKGQKGRQEEPRLIWSSQTNTGNHFISWKE